jgi:hypothetical protein
LLEENQIYKTKKKQNKHNSKIKNGTKVLEKLNSEETQTLFKEIKKQKSKNEKNNLTQKNKNTSDSICTDDEHIHSQIEFNIYFFIKLIIALAGTLIIFINTIYGFLFPYGNVGCMEDLLFENTKTINHFFAANTKHRDFLLIIASLCIDISLIYMLVIWVSYGKSYRFIATLSIFYVLRSSEQVNYF